MDADLASHYGSEGRARAFMYINSIDWTSWRTREEADDFLGSDGRRAQLRVGWPCDRGIHVSVPGDF